MSCCARSMAAHSSSENSRVTVLRSTPPTSPSTRAATERNGLGISLFHRTPTV